MAKRDANDRKLDGSLAPDEDLKNARWSSVPTGEPGSKLPLTRQWPALSDAAYHGLLGEIVRTIEPHSEADPVALLVQLHAAIGIWIGAGPHVRVGAEPHPAREYVALIGATASGRKGTAWSEVRRVVTLADREWSTGTGRRIMSGLSSGEGVIHAVRDEVTTQQPQREGGKKSGGIRGYETVVTDAGEQDKRLLIIEPELCAVLGRARREGSTLSAIVRQAWDNGDLAVLVRGGGSGGYRATGAHVGIIAHITRDELLRVLDATEQANGFANRFLWVCTRRSKELPDGGTLGDADLAPLVHRLVVTVERARTFGAVPRTERATALWHAVYPDLTAERPGMLGAMLARGAPHVLRLALVYALLDASAVIDAPHLEAALAVWHYCADSVRWTWGEATGDGNADAVLTALRRAGPVGVTRTGIRDLFAGHLNEATTTRALATLADARLARSATSPTGGRPVERWFATGATNAT